MRTPWGNVVTVDVNDHTIAENIVCTDKHQLAEGLVVECLFDQIAGALPASSPQKLVSVDVETIVVDTQRSSEQWIAFVWARTKSEGLGRYLLALERRFVPYLLEFDPASGFVARRLACGKSVGPAEPLETLMRRLSDQYAPLNVDQSVRDATRQKHAFWGFISNYYGSRIGKKVILPRLLINWGIQPYFRRVWNLDRIFVMNDQVWLLEIKHKFPMELPPKENFPTLRFGINAGELNVIGLLQECGIRCLHTILVKPFWSPQAGSMYLMNDLSSRAHAALIAAEVDRKVIAMMMSGRAGKSGGNTTLTGDAGISYRSLPATRFRYLGLLADLPESIARQMVSVMAGEPVRFVQERELRELRKAYPG